MVVQTGRPASYLVPPPMPAPVVVMKDVGGLVRTIRRTELYRSQNREVRLHECRSGLHAGAFAAERLRLSGFHAEFHQAYNEIPGGRSAAAGQLWSPIPPPCVKNSAISPASTRCCAAPS